MSKSLAILKRLATLFFPQPFRHSRCQARKLDLKLARRLHSVYVLSVGRELCFSGCLLELCILTFGAGRKKGLGGLMISVGCLPRPASLGAAVSFLETAALFFSSKGG